MASIKAPSRTVAQPIAHVLRLSRARFAEGGSALAGDATAGERWHVGPIRSAIKGRTDRVPLTVPPNAYVIPADVVSGMGEGNTEAGHLEIQRELRLRENSSGYARGGGIKIMAAGGEHVVAPADVRRMGGGSMEKGHTYLDRWVVSKRKQIVKTMTKLPGPKTRD